MKQISNRRLKRIREAAPVRDALKARVGRCEHCLKPTAPEYLDCDEIARGSSRQQALDEPCSILVVHRLCHGLIQNWSRAKRLALLYLVRSSDYDLERFWQITGRRFPEQEDVDREIRLLLDCSRMDKIAGAGVEAPASLNTLSRKGAKHV